MNGVFSSVGQALHVAFLMEVCPVTSQGSTQTFIEWLKRAAGIRPEGRDESERRIDFRGLQPHEVRGQCAMVRATVEHHLTLPERHAVWARFACLQTRRAAGIRELAHYVQPLTGITRDEAVLAIALNVYHPAAHDRMSLREIEKEYGISKSAAGRAAQVMKAQGARLRTLAEGRLLPLFEGTGLVATEDEATPA